MRQSLAIVGGVAVILAAGVVHGLWTNRWNDGSDLRDAAARLGSLPLDAGDWKGQRRELDSQHVAHGEIAGYVRGSCFNPKTGRSASVILMCGRFGPLSVHTPDICYGGAGYEMVGRPVRYSVKYGDRTATFWTAQFHKPQTPGAAPMRMFWGWNPGNGWQAPESPRWTFRTAPVLHKLYAYREMTRLDEPMESDPCVEYLREWLPLVEAGAFPPVSR